MYSQLVSFTNTFRGCLFSYCVIMAVLFSPFWFSGDVVTPTTQSVLLSDFSAEETGRIQNRKFTDYPTGFIPLVSDFLDGERSGWLALWTSNNELGKPLHHTFGFSPAYFPSWLLSLLISDAFVFISVVSLLTCFLGGLFLFLLCCDRGLHPLVSLVAAVSLAASPYFIYWLSFPFFFATWCWTIGALYAMSKLSAKPGLTIWALLVFCLYSLLIAAYPQLVVFHAYILISYGVYLLLGRWQRVSQESSLKLCGLLIAAVIAAVLLALPVYLDQLHNFISSPRVDTGIGFFSVVPQFETPISFLNFLVISVFPEILGNVVSQDYPIRLYDGISVSPVIVFLFMFGALTQYKNTWGWLLLSIVFVFLSLSESGYEFAWNYLGFSLSRSSPFATLILPVTIVAAYGANVLVSERAQRDISLPLFTAGAGYALFLLMGLYVAQSQSIEIDWFMICFYVILLFMLLAQHFKPRPLLLLLCILLSCAVVSYPKILRQQPESISLTSTLVESVQNHLPKDSRYALVLSDFGLMPPNMNASLNIPSIHSYNSLSSISYHRLIDSLGGKMVAYGRRNSVVSPDYNAIPFWMSNIGLVLSTAVIEDRKLKHIGEDSGIHMYQTVERMGCCFLMKFDASRERNITLEDINKSAHFPVKKIEDKEDFLRFSVDSPQPSLLIISQQYHHQWKARGLSGSQWIELSVDSVNGFFTGVLLPAGIEEVELEFSPYVAYAWLGHLLWVFLVAFLAIRRLYTGHHV